MVSNAAATVLLLFALVSSASAFNITKILGDFSDFTTFNNLLSQTSLADEINRRQTITVLVVANSAASAISSLPADIQKKVLAVHVVLDYYDPVKLDALKNKSALLTTLFQTTGVATNRMGFVNYTQRADDQMVFGSAEPGASVNSQLVKVVASRPYNISVMQISSAIMPPSIGDTGKAKSPPPAPAPAKANATSPSPAPSKKAAAPAHAKSPKASPPVKSVAPAPSDDASAPATSDAPAPSDDASAPAPAADAPEADAPEAGDAPVSSPPEPGSEAADAPAPSAASKVVVGAGVGLMGLVMLVI